MKALYPKDALGFRANYQGKEKNKEQDLENYQGYCGHISAIDRELGRIFQRLDELKLSQNTLVIYTSDHGSMFGEHGKSSKRHPEEESILVPFLARWPGNIPAGVRPDQLFGTIDIFPTLCGLAGLAVPPLCHGLNFAPAVRGESMRGPESQFIMHISNKKEYEKVVDNPKAEVFRGFFRGVRTRQYTYAVGVNGPWMLYDIQNDPYQMKNLINDPPHAQVQAECQKQLDGWLSKAEYELMPPDVKSKVMSMNLPDRIAWQNIEAVQFSAKQKAGGLQAESE
jgi:arylsulfatase A-like enzyme